MPAARGGLRRTARMAMEPPRSACPPVLEALAGAHVGERSRRSSWVGRSCVAGSLVAFTILHSAVIWPGRMSDDTFVQLEAVRSGRYSDWHAPLLMILWRPLWLLGVGAGLVTAATTLIFLLGLYGVLRSLLRRGTALVATFAIVLFPPVLGYLGYLGRDLWFVASFLAIAAGLARLSSTRGRRARRALLGAVLAGLWLMAATRQNALPVAGMFLLALLNCCGPWPALGRFDATGGCAGTTMGARAVRVTVAIVALGCLIGSQSLVRAAFHVRVTHPEQALFLYDVAGVSVRVHENLFSPAVQPAQDLASLERDWQPRWVNSLIFGDDPALPFPVAAGAESTLRGDWLRTIRDHPAEYLKVRWALWERQIALHTPAWWIYQPGIAPNQLGYETAHPGLDRPLQRYLQANVVDDMNGGGNLYKLWLYLAITVLGVAYLRHRDPARRLLGWCCGCSLLYQGTVFVGAMGADYRMVYPSVVLAAIITGVALADLKAWLTQPGRSMIASIGAAKAGPTGTGR